MSNLHGIPVIVCAGSRLMRETIANLVGLRAEFTPVAVLASIDDVRAAVDCSDTQLTIVDLTLLPERVAASSRRTLRSLAGRTDLIFIMDPLQTAGLGSLARECRADVVLSSEGAEALYSALSARVGARRRENWFVAGCGQPGHARFSA